MLLVCCRGTLVPPFRDWKLTLETGRNITLIFILLQSTCTSGTTCTSGEWSGSRWVHTCASRRTKCRRRSAKGSSSTLTVSTSVICSANAFDPGKTSKFSQLKYRTVYLTLQRASIKASCRKRLIIYVYLYIKKGKSNYFQFYN